MEMATATKTMKKMVMPTGPTGQVPGAAASTSFAAVAWTLSGMLWILLGDKA
ncbi:hypothetical protein [Blastococcus capsensis]|uniref:hypothetical protein n=1 Tax=Blastococcus capsensis TaxID=1564163 RepID=UPI0025411CB3|nr:hypothetical protein [Blastococcus capsensis]MDK3258300.1 hypothetical protein [Blastococcus capsensis]